MGREVPPGAVEGFIADPDLEGGPLTQLFPGITALLVALSWWSGLLVYSGFDGRWGRLPLQLSGAWIDPGSVSDPSQLFPVADTGYRIRFTSATGYSVESFPLATPNVTTTEGTGTFTSGRAITLHGTRVNIAGAPVAGDQFEITPSTPTLNLFTALDQAVAHLKQPGLTGSQRAQGTSDALRNVDASLASLSDARSAAGEVLNSIDAVTSRLSSQKLDAQTQRSNAEDLDLVQALSDFQNKQNGYDAALKSYSAVQKLSLFQYINP
jgi:flagellar hook-associated protein 3 FlgL